VGSGQVRSGVVWSVLIWQGRDRSGEVWYGLVFLKGW
jgi:hypothetical protein